MLHTSNKPDADLSAFYESWEEEYWKPEYNLKGFKIWFYFVFEKKKRRQCECDYLKGRVKKKGHNECNGQLQCNRGAQD